MFGRPAAAVAGILTKMVWANVSLSTIYPDCDGGQGKTGSSGWGLFDMESKPGAVTWRPLTHAYAAFGELAQTTPTLLPVTVGSPAETASFTVLAGRRGDSSMKVLISSQQSNSSSVALAVTGLGMGSWQWSASVIDAAHNSSATVAGSVERTTGGAVAISFPLVAPAVALVRMDKVGRQVGASATSALKIKLDDDMQLPSADSVLGVMRRVDSYFQTSPDVKVEGPQGSRRRVDETVI